MDIFIDDSGSLNSTPKNYCDYFVVALIYSKNGKELKKAHKRFVAANLTELRKVDKPKVNSKTGRVRRKGNQMFVDGKFRELKGNVFSGNLKKKFLTYFNRPDDIEVYYIKIANKKLTTGFCKNTARAFNYTLRLAVQYYIKQRILPDQVCNLHLDERNEKTETKHFLCDYLNTELVLGGHCVGPFTVEYCNSANVRQIQIADVFANTYYSHLINGGYTAEFDALKASGVVKGIFEFPLQLL